MCDTYQIMMRFLIFAMCTILFAQRLRGQDIVFPDDDESYTHVSGSQPVTERKPVKIANHCPENELLYPDDGPKSAWVCDCQPRFIYFPKNDSCHEAFMRGPCPPQHYVYLAPNETIPNCILNPCTEDGYVPYKGVCHRLRTKGGPCDEDAVLGVNETTFQLECVSADLVPFVIIEAPKRGCPKGSRRNSLGICKLVL